MSVCFGIKSFFDSKKAVFQKIKKKLTDISA
jgi:hypothetical protein